MARSTQMADIDQYIADAKQAAPAPVSLDTSAPTDAVNAPEIENAKTGEQASDATPVPEDEEQERASIREMRKAQLEADRQRTEESNAARKARQAVEVGSDAIATTREVVKQNALRVGNVVGAVPIPGDLLLPLSILLIFFFALIAVNGHTRLMWLWLTLTGNASLTTGAGASFATTPVVPTLGALPTPSLSSTLTPLTILPFAGAGEVT